MKNKTFQEKLKDILTHNGNFGRIPEHVIMELEAITALIESDLIRQASDYTSTEGDEYADGYNQAIGDVLGEQRSILHDTGEKR